MRTPGIARRTRRGGHRAGPRHPDVQSRALGEDGADHQLRRERRVLRSRHTADSSSRTPGEFVTVPDIDAVSSSQGIRGPIGLGYRVPGLIISPYSRGGLVASETFDHTSQPRLLETRFGVEVPNLTPWRRSVTGDVTSAFDFGSPPNSTTPRLMDPIPRVQLAAAQCGPDVAAGFVGRGAPYPVPPNSMPTQEPGSRRAPTGMV
jgi:phospholipase C